jgi:hypothetical protein
LCGMLSSSMVLRFVDINMATLSKAAFAYQISN